MVANPRKWTEKIKKGINIGEVISRNNSRICTA
jgi:hypothetical protein